jgi:hypothetical protein
VDFSSAKANNLKVCIEPVEGVSCQLVLYVTPEAFDKYSQVVRIPIKPLSAHEKVSEIPEGRTMNSMAIKGKYDVNQMNTWFFDILPGINSTVQDKVGRLVKTVGKTLLLLPNHRQLPERRNRRGKHHSRN